MSKCEDCGAVIGFCLCAVRRREAQECPARGDGGAHLIGLHDGKCRLCGQQVMVQQ